MPKKKKVGEKKKVTHTIRDEMMIKYCLFKGKKHYSIPIAYGIHTL